MKVIQAIGVVALIVVVAVLAVTAIPSLGGEALHGSMLLVHMMASGALVIGLPVLALALLTRTLATDTGSPRSLLWGWLACIATGLITIASVFCCMLPIASTETMHQLVAVHGYAGFAMVPATLLLAVGFWKASRIRPTR